MACSYVCALVVHVCVYRAHPISALPRSVLIELASMYLSVQMPTMDVICGDAILLLVYVHASKCMFVAMCSQQENGGFSCSMLFRINADRLVEQASGDSRQVICG